MRMMMENSEDALSSLHLRIPLRQWFWSKCRVFSSRIKQTIERETQQVKQELHSLVITPESIPAFTIPRMDVRKRTSASDESTHSEGSSQDSQVINPEDGGFPGRPPALTESSNPTETATPRAPQRAARRTHAISYEMIEETPRRTNADPRSEQALGLPHLKTKTRFGFETLLESPSTNRKESLFHGQYGKQARHASLYTHGRPYHTSEASISCRPISTEQPNRSRKRRRNVVSQVAPLGIPLNSMLSAQSVADDPSLGLYRLGSECNSRLPRASLPHNVIAEESGSDSDTTKYFSHADRRQHRCRRQATIVPVDSLDLNSGSDSASSDDETRSSPSHTSSDTLCLDASDVAQLLRLSAVTSTTNTRSSLPANPDTSPRGPRVHVLNNVPNSSEELKFVVKYLPRSHRLSVFLLRGYNIGGETRSDVNLNPFVKVTLVPGKFQRFSTNIARHTKNPVFNKCFYFDDIDSNQLPLMRLFMKVMDRGFQLRRDQHLGDVEVDLADLDFETIEEHKLRRQLQPVIQDLGRLKLSLCFHAREERLEVSNIVLTELPPTSNTGMLNPYVRVELSQPGRQDTRDQTTFKKKTTTATFNETFKFPISPKIEDLNYTCLTITVLDHEAIRTDSVIGQVQLGYAATEESEFDHWNHVLQFPGREFEAQHVIMEED